MPTVEAWPELDALPHWRADTEGISTVCCRLSGSWVGPFMQRLPRQGGRHFGNGLPALSGCTRG